MKIWCIKRHAAQLLRQRAQRIHQQPVHTPTDGNGKNQRQQKIGRYHGRQRRQNKLINAERIGL